MNPDEEARAQAEAALKEKGWTPALVEAGRVVLRPGFSPVEESLVREAFKRLARYEAAVRTLEEMGWTVRTARLTQVTMTVGNLESRLGIEAVTECEGREIRYTLRPTEGEWFHWLEGLGVSRYAPAASHVMSPESALRLLIEARQEELWYEREAGSRLA